MFLRLAEPSTSCARVRQSLERTSSSSCRQGVFNWGGIGRVDNINTVPESFMMLPALRGLKGKGWNAFHAVSRPAKNGGGGHEGSILIPHDNDRPVKRTFWPPRLRLWPRLWPKRSPEWRPRAKTNESARLMQKQVPRPMTPHPAAELL